MDPLAKQAAKYQARHMMSVLTDKTKIALKTIKGEDMQVRRSSAPAGPGRRPAG
jgi:hypothetical protein